MEATTFNKEKFTALKNDIKSLTIQIRTAKIAHKEAQRKNDFPWVAFSLVKSLKFEARHKLIAYSLTKGKEYGCVENKVHEGNEPCPNLSYEYLYKI